MLKKSIKYFIVVSANAIVLILLLWAWTDKVEIEFNIGVRIWEFLKIIGFSIASFIALRLLVIYFRRKNITATRSKIRMAVLLTLLISSYLYVTYSGKIIDNLSNSKIRSQISNKIKSSSGSNEVKVENLTIKEYQQIVKLYKFPPLPDEASDVSIDYWYDGFLPDYSLTLIYDVAAQIDVDTINYWENRFQKIRSFEMTGNTKRVTYSETQY